MTASPQRSLTIAAAVAQAKIVLAILLTLAGAVSVGLADLFRLGFVSVLFASSVLLLATKANATQSRALGRVMALLGAGLSLRLVLPTEYRDLWVAIRPEAFLAAATLDFAGTFAAGQVGIGWIQLALAWGMLDATIHVVLAAGAVMGLEPWQRLFAIIPSRDWIPAYLMALVSLVPLMRALGASHGTERRQLRLFVNGLAIGVAPFALILPAAALVRSFNNWLALPQVQPYFLALTYPFLFVFPITATYAVLYQGVLDYQSALRRAAQYALARYTLMMLIALPVGAGLVLLYANRAEPLGNLLTGWRFLALLAVAATAAAALPLRYRLLAALDRRYFREAYDARRVLRDLTESVRKTPDISDLSKLIVEQVDKALHPESVVVMTAKPGQPGLLQVASARGVADPEPVTCSSQFVSLLAGASDPLPIETDAPGSLMGRLPDKEKDWLKRAGASLLVPLHGSGEALTGFLVLGPKKSETPFTEEDRDLLASVGGAAGMSIETRLLRATPTPGGDGSTPPYDTTPPARECLLCLQVFDASVLSCASCNAATVPALLPVAVLDKYKLQSRLGSGGFGVVYGALETRLGRRVALKTLPRVSGEKLERFKREALAAAAIRHPNLAMIHTAETWNETPVLVFELLEGGTLAQRLLTAPLSIHDALVLGKAMASVLEEAHRQGILHRDIKPSNIGYDARQTPKLLDFGIARIRDPSTPAVARHPDTVTLERLRTEASMPQTQDSPLTETGVIVGTPAYLPLEAYQDREPSAAFDLWGLAVTLYESLSGINPFRAASPAETIERLLRHTPTPLHELRPDCPRGLSDLLTRALSRDSSERPRSAADLLQALQEVEVQR